MGCRCNERRQAIMSLVRPQTQGASEEATVRNVAEFVGRTMVEDAQSAFTSKVTAAKAALMLRR